MTDSKDYDGLGAVSSGSTLFAYVTLLVFKIGSVKLVLVAANLAIFFSDLAPDMCSIRVWVLCLVMLKRNNQSIMIKQDIMKTSLFKYTEILPPKNENFQIKIFDILHISTQNVDCGYALEPPRRGGSNAYPQSIFWAEIRKIMHTPVNPSFTI